MRGLRSLVLATVSILSAGCAAHQAGEMAESGSINSLTSAQASAGWRLLFDGRTLAGWRGYRQHAVPAGWVVVNGALTKDVSTGDIVTDRKYGDFETELEWKLGTGGNAGVFYRATEEYDHVYWSAPEYQLLDDANHPDGHSRLTSAGAAYGLYPPPAGIVKPANEWNTTRIIVRGSHVEHWLNGVKLLEYELGSADWQAKVKASKFGEWPNYGKASEGYIAIQGDHDGTLSLRNIRIREFR
ncbi:MAG: DUF1080 domain-containing protein [Gemmatimonadota bacterium]